MRKSAILAVGASAALGVSIMVPATSASAARKGVYCNDGVFTVVHADDTINGFPIPQGQYATYVKKMSCLDASMYLHNWLGYDKTTNGFKVKKGNAGPGSIKFKKGKRLFFQIVKVNN